MDMFPGRLYQFLAISTNNASLWLPKHQQEATANSPHLCINRDKLQKAFSYPPDPPVTEIISAVPYKPYTKELQQIENHRQLSKEKSQTQKDWSENVTILDNYKQHKVALTSILAEFLEV